MKNIALYAIRFYQRAISPYKGFRCAYAFHSGCASCSALGYRAIRRFGVWRGLGVLNGRLEKCGVAYRRHHAGPLARQAGFLDCGDCEATPCEMSTCDCDTVSLCRYKRTCQPRDCSRKKPRTRKKHDKDVVIPSRRKRHQPPI